MVSSKFIFTAGLLLLSSFSSAAPGLKNMDTNSGPVNKVEIWALGLQTPPKCKNKHPKGLLDLLKKNHQEEFCKLYINRFPVVTKHATVTSCGKKNPKCLPTTVTRTIDVTQTVTDTVTANTPTVTDNEVSSTTTTVTPTITITSTVGVPLTGSAPVKRGIHPPPSLDGYQPAQISSACSVFIHTLTHTRTTTITDTMAGNIKTSTVPFITVATNTVTATATPPAITITEIVDTTTLILTAPTVTQTTTICPNATHGISGISVGPSGSLTGVNAANEIDCCTACIVNGPGCVGWAF